MYPLLPKNSQLIKRDLYRVLHDSTTNEVYEYVETRCNIETKELQYVFKFYHKDIFEVIVESSSIEWIIHWENIDHEY